MSEEQGNLIILLLVLVLVGSATSAMLGSAEGISAEEFEVFVENARVGVSGLWDSGIVKTMLIAAVIPLVLWAVFKGLVLLARAYLYTPRIGGDEGESK